MLKEMLHLSFTALMVWLQRELIRTERSQLQSMTVSRGKNILVLNQKRMVLSRP